MLDSTTLVIAAVTRRLVDQYRHVFGHRQPDHAGAIATAARLALERIGTSDAPYHDVGYVRGACRGDTATEVVVDLDGTRLALPRGASDAWLTPYHVDRSKL